MSRTTLPPTPASSTDIHGRDDTEYSVTDKAFNLPPPAIFTKQTNGANSASKHAHPSTNPNFSLPPPPTRSRTIIQMKPKPQETQDVVEPSSQQSGKVPGKKARAGSTPNAAGKKQYSSTSVAGKKIARKTAHSVIERRRRSKMNEEFGVLKAMIPACTDQEMHKLAILQASIDYLRYLEKCITDLKAANNSLSTPLVQPQAPPPRPRADHDHDPTNESDSDIEMSNSNPLSAARSPTFPAHLSQAPAYTSPQSITNSPALDKPPRYHSASYSSLSTLPSPAFGPQHHRPRSQHSQSLYSASTSPTIMPSQDQDQEATAALLMLNQERRDKPREGGRGMSVKDLLTC